LNQLISAIFIPIPKIKVIGSAGGTVSGGTVSGGTVSGGTVSGGTVPSDGLDSILGTSQYYVNKNIKKTD